MRSGLRQRLKNDMRASRATHEHKLAFAAYLHDVSGGILLAKMAQATGKTREEVLSQLQALPPLEFYMPVAAHRATWTGGDNLIVAAQLEEGQPPIGFLIDGTPVTLKLDEPPATPVLALVPVETDFSQELPSSDWRNVDDKGGQTIGTLVRLTGGRAPRSAPRSAVNLPSGFSTANPEALTDARALVAADICDPSTAIVPCDDGSDGGNAPPPAVYPAGVYLDRAHVSHLGEDWPRGDAEIELFVIGPTFSPEANGEKISCSGEHAGSIKHYDQNTSDFQAAWWSVQAQILSMAEVGHYQEIYNAPYSLQLWEDDDTGCEIVSHDRSRIEELYDDLRSAQRATTLLISIISGGLHISPGTINAIRALIDNNPLDSDDDFLGNVVYTPGTTRTNQWGDSFVDGDLVLTDGTSNGTVTICTINVAHEI